MTTRRVALARPSLIPAGNISPNPTEFDNASWTKTSCTISANAGIAPDGSYTADRWVEASGAGLSPFVGDNLAIVSGVRYHLGIYIKSVGTARYLEFSGGAIAAAGECPNFNPDNGTIDFGATSTIVTAGSGARMTHVGNGWYRCEMTVVAGNTSAFGYLLADSSTSNTFGTYAGDGASGLLIWGAWNRRV
jgi:hypothetical protein